MTKPKKSTIIKATIIFLICWSVANAISSICIGNSWAKTEATTIEIEKHTLSLGKCPSLLEEVRSATNANFIIVIIAKHSKLADVMVGVERTPKKMKLTRESSKIMYASCENLQAANEVARRIAEGLFPKEEHWEKVEWRAISLGGIEGSEDYL